MIKPFVGLDSPGADCEATRHDAGFWLRCRVDLHALVRQRRSGDVAAQLFQPLAVVRLDPHCLRKLFRAEDSVPYCDREPS